MSNLLRPKPSETCHEIPFYTPISTQQRDWCDPAAKLRVDECWLPHSRTALSLCHQERITMTVRSIKDRSILTRAYTIPSCPAGHARSAAKFAANGETTVNDRSGRVIRDDATFFLWQILVWETSVFLGGTPHPFLY